MKAQTKALVASLVVIALALSAVSGITYSWFSDSEQADITVTTGKIELNFESGSDITAVYEEFPYTSVSTGVSMTWTTDSTGVKTTTISSMMLKDMDKLTFSIPKIIITNTIEANYYEQLTIKEGDSEVTDPYFTVTGLNEAAVSYAPVSGQNTNTVDAHGIEVLFNSENAAQGKTYTISLKFVAIQSNGPTPAGKSTTVSTTGETSVTVNAGTEGSATVTIPQQKEESKAVVSEADQQLMEKSYSLSSGLTVVSGVEVKGYDSTGNQIQNYLKDQSVTVTLVIDGKCCDDSGKLLTGFQVYHGNAVFTPGTGESIKASYNESTDKTTVTITTLQGFSPYAMVVDAVASVGDRYYGSVQDAVYAAESGQTVRILGELRIDDGKEHTIKLNGNTLEIPQMITISHGTLILEGNGTVLGCNTIEKYPYVIGIVGSTNSNDISYSVLNIGKDVTVKNVPNTMGGSFGVCIFYHDISNKVSYGSELFVNGTIDATWPMYANGEIQTLDGNIPKISVNGATITGDQSYIAGYCKTEIKNSTINGSMVFKGGSLDYSNNTLNFTVEQDYPEGVAYVKYGNGAVGCRNVAISIDQIVGYAGVSPIKFSGTNIFNFTDKDGKDVSNSAYFIEYTVEKKSNVTPDFGTIDKSKILNLDLESDSIVATMEVKFDRPDSKGQTATFYFTDSEAAQNLKTNIITLFPQYYFPGTTNISAEEIWYRNADSNGSGLTS